MRSTVICALLGSALAAGAAGCSTAPTRETPSAGVHRDRLYIRSNGQMQLNHLPIDAEDVVIYPDGRGGERAAVKVRTEVHPPFYRDTISVLREAPPEQSAPSAP